MPLIFQETLENGPFGDREGYFKGGRDKNMDFIEIYEEILKYLEATRKDFGGKGGFLYEHLMFLLNKKIE